MTSRFSQNLYDGTISKVRFGHSTTAPFRKYMSLFCCLTLAEGCHRYDVRHGIIGWSAYIMKLILYFVVLCYTDTHLCTHRDLLSMSGGRHQPRLFLLRCTRSARSVHKRHWQMCNVWRTAYMVCRWCWISVGITHASSALGGLLSHR